jgi:hypothetical protein
MKISASGTEQTIALQSQENRGVTKERQSGNTQPLLRTSQLADGGIVFM